MFKRSVPLFARILCVTLVCVSTTVKIGRASQNKTDLLRVRFSHLRHGINLSHWFAQSPNDDYSKDHLQTHTTVEDIALIKTMGFDHVRFTIEPVPLMTPGDPGKLKSDYLQYFDAALDMLLAQGLAVVVDIHPSNEFKARLNDDRHVENFAKFWRALSEHLSKRDPEKVFLETINEPMVEDPYR